MRYLKKIRMMLLALVLAALTMGQSQTAFAADEEYTYTVRLFAGNLGELTGDGLQIESAGASVDSDKDQVVISGLRYGDTVRIIYQEAAASADERYYVRGVRRSGRDNTEAEAPTFEVACDRDYVVAYAVSGDLVGYTVHYLDASGNPLMPSDTYYGNAGERQYVSSRYIDGYQPQALNLVKTLSANESENVFEFRYTPVPEGTTAPTAPTAPTETTTTTTTVTAPATPATPGTTAPTTPAAPEEPDAEPDEGEEDQDEGIGGDAGVVVPDEEVPQADRPDQMQDLDDEEVPLANLGQNQNSRVMGYLPVYIGIGVAAALALAGTAVYLKKRRKAPAVTVEKVIEELTDREN